MRPETLLKQVLLIAAFAGFAISAWIIIYSYFTSKRLIRIKSAALIENAGSFSQQKQAIPDELPDVTAGRPIRIKIPEIGIDSALGYVGITPAGAMDIPKNQDDIVWLEVGPRPGENGSAVVAGHYGWKEGKGSAFDDLHKLRAGDKLYIEDNKGATISFVVRKIRRYDPKEDTTSVFVPNDGKSHLNLVTCEGNWNESAETYSQRLVVFSDKE
ncbi:MAG: class F sortase [Candidatus Paceibacterota bacterium]